MVLECTAHRSGSNTTDIMVLLQPCGLLAFYSSTWSAVTFPSCKMSKSSRQSWISTAANTKCQLVS
ncbi:hypothetical protein DPMN_162498 [Dreissena polymorpha]|uniref:Uncharacterized protein n=1 Tax=Dreissena polymorpha TaxID=45954 RepID=A0A9D4EU77_DREPO|nr:hypothetical protein DPMN_162498 [Dreissena polymorpha]